MSFQVEISRHASLPFDTHLAHLVDGANHRVRNRMIDALFNSLAAHAGTRAIGVVLSGLSDDGSRGLAAIQAAGGVTMVLDRGNRDRGMPLNAIEYDGPIDLLGTVEQIAAGIGARLPKLQPQP